MRFISPTIDEFRVARFPKRKIAGLIAAAALFGAGLASSADAAATPAPQAYGTAIAAVSPAESAMASAPPSATSFATPSATPLPTVESTTEPSAGPTGSPGSSASPAPAVFPVTNHAPLPKCGTSETPTLVAGYDDWALTLVDTDFTVGQSYVPPDLQNVGGGGFYYGTMVRAVAVADLRAMGDAARGAGAPLSIFSSYRDYHTQIWTFNYWVNMLGPQAAALSSARPGHSEHQLGVAIDFKSSGGPDPWSTKNWARDTAAGQWMAANAWRYGFVMSYPAGKTAVTCYGFEPWHYRYVGRAEAAAIHNSGLTVREWIWLHLPEQSPRERTPAHDPRTQAI